MHFFFSQVGAKGTTNPNEKKEKKNSKMQIDEMAFVHFVLFGGIKKINKFNKFIEKGQHLCRQAEREEKWFAWVTESYDKNRQRKRKAKRISHIK